MPSPFHGSRLLYIKLSVSDLHRNRTVFLFVIIAALFLIANRAAYQGYFGDDEFDNLALTRAIGPGEAVTGLLWPRYYENNFRPVGHLFYRALAGTIRSAKVDGFGLWGLMGISFVYGNAAPPSLLVGNQIR